MRSFHFSVRTRPAVLAAILIPILFASAVPAAQGATPGADFYFDLETARESARAGDLQAAAAEYERLLAISSDDVRNWARLGSAYYGLKRWEPAARAFETAYEQGTFFTANTAYNAACCHALLGNTDKAFLWLERALEVPFEDRNLLREDTDLVSLHGDPRWARMAWPLTPDMDRDAGWRHDLDYFANEIERMHPAPYREHTAEEFTAAFATLRERVPALSDEQIWVEMQRIVVMLGDGHSVVVPGPHSRVAMATLPLHLYAFTDGVFVIDSDEAHRDLVGSRVVAMGGRPMETLMVSVNEVVNKDNPMGVAKLGPYFLSMPAVLENLGGVVGDDGVAVVLVAPDGQERTVTVAADGGEGDMSSGHSHRRFGMAVPPDVEPPLHLARGRENFWFEPLSDPGVVFIQYNAVRDADDETVAAFAERLRAYVLEHDVHDLVVDVRLNGGGNSFLNPPLVKTLIEFERRRPEGGLYVLAGRETFSACQNFITDVDWWTGALFAGEPSGSSPNMIGESSFAPMPFSALRLNISSRYHQQSYPGDDRVWIAPDIPVGVASADHFAGRDPVLEAVLEVIERRQAGEGNSASD